MSCASLFLLALSGFGCGSVASGDGGGDPFDSGGSDARRDGGRDRLDGRDDRIDSSSLLPDGYNDPGCPDSTAPPVEKQCDPLAIFTGCPTGESCHPYVRYPSEPCEYERYGTRCEKGGLGKQGDPCGGVTNCASGYVCLVTGAGTVCASICKPGGKSSCPEGLVCSPFDVPGYGGCL
ncbi:MAG: hypothetical protein NVS3B20_20300 [Polyangiales bacterium]